MLEGKAIGRSGVEGGQLGGREARVEGCRLARCDGRGAGTVHQRHGVVLQVVRSTARALVRVRHGAALLQAPLAGRDAAVYTARARCRGGDHAGLLGVEAGRHLHHEGDILAACAVVGKRNVLSACHLAFAGGDLALRVHIGAIQRAVAAGRRHVEHGAVVGVDGGAAQLGCGGLERVGIGRWHGRRQPRGAQASRQQVVAGAVVRDLADGAQVGGLGVECGAVAITAAAGSQHRSGQHCGQERTGKGTRNGTKTRVLHAHLHVPVSWSFFFASLLHSSPTHPG